MYAQIAVNAYVEGVFDYHIPPELEGKLQPGHLVQIPFGTALQHGIVLSLSKTSAIRQTKPVLARLDPRPVLSEAQMDLARWLSETYLAPLGVCLWLLLPPGITGGHDLRVTLVDENAETADALEAEIVALLKRRGTLRGQQLNLALAGKTWRASVDALAKSGAVEKEHVLTPPRVRPKTIQTVTLAIHPNEIDGAAQALARPSRRADLLEAIAQFDGAFRVTRAQRPVVDKLVEAGLAAVSADNTATLAIPREALPERLLELRKLDKALRILKLLAREGEPMDVSWVYAQADATLNDLKRLADEGLVILSEKPAWRDSLAERDFTPARPPTLTPEQERAWAQVKAAVERYVPSPTPPLNPLPVNGEGKETPWRTPPHLWKKLRVVAQEMRHEPTQAENVLGQALRRKQVGNYIFRRQHTIERFIVDFYCREANLIIEVDGEIHQYTKEEDAIRQEFLESLGLAVVRFSNYEVLNKLSDVLNRIRSTLNERRQASPLSVYGEGQGEGSIFLLHGVTGSGKTEIYLRAIERTLELGRSAIFLVPEIALTAQTVRRVAARFAGRVAVVHSGLSIGERYDTWRRARDGLVQVVVGARSALFTPLPDVGLIILDEEHDHSYKQAESGVGFSPPYYHARDVAEAMMRRNDGVLILGSATPDLETSFRARRGEIQLLHLPSRIMGHRERIRGLAERKDVATSDEPGGAGDVPTIDLPPVRIVDMRRELRTGNTSIFSRALQASLKTALKRHEQAILFINRRGQSTYVFCRDCGYVALCPRCDAPLTHHRMGEALRCHRCGYEQPAPDVCPNCRSKRIKFFGAGTQQVEQALHAMFPDARAVRWDADTAASPEAHDSILQRFMDRHADVLIGTQMVAKGLDLPMVTLVGVVSADMGLALPDFRAGERTFQVLTQVAGRAGRGLLGGQVILQTYQPEHYAIAAASRHDYDTFYEREIAYRRDLGYPPFRRLVRIIFRFDSEGRARAEAERAAAQLRQRIERLDMTGTELIGPAPCVFTKINRFYRWHLLLRGPDPAAALRDMDIPKGWFVDVDPVDVL